MMRVNVSFFRTINSQFSRVHAALTSNSATSVKTVETDLTGVAGKKQYKKSEKSSMVAQVFAKLTEDSVPSPKTVLSPSEMKKRINNCSDLDSLLNIGKNPKLSRENALEILSTLGDWTAQSKIKLSDFETDLRFLNMCKILGDSFKLKNGLTELSAVLGVTGDDEAAKLIASTSLGQMVKILSKLSSSKKRSPPLLCSLAFHISKSTDKLTIKQCADVLYSIANLNFRDEILIVKVCADAQESLVDGIKSSVTASIARSIGILRVKDSALLDSIVDWVIRNASQARTQDIVAVIMALAIVNHRPSSLDKFWQVVLPLLRPLDLPSSAMYLDAVWSLLILDVATREQIAFVLSPTFIEKLRNEDGDTFTHSTMLKLLNINAAAESLLNQYQGPLLNNNYIQSNLHYGRSKDKLALLACVMDSLSNLLPSETFLKRDVDIGAGFLIDGECLFDENCTPLAVNKSHPKAVRIAIQVLGYHDTCLGSRYQPNGMILFRQRILEVRNYRVINILHSEFNPSSKLVARVQYLEQKIKDALGR